MSARKTPIPKDGPLPPLTRLKQLPPHDQESILLWLEDKPQEEVAALIERNFAISCESAASWPATLSRFRAWALRRPQIEAANDFTDFLKQRLEDTSNAPVTEMRDWLITTLAVIADRIVANPAEAKLQTGFLLRLAKELRAIDSLGLAKDKWREERAKKLDLAFGELGKEVQNNPAALAAYEKMREALAKE